MGPNNVNPGLIARVQYPIALLFVIAAISPNEAVLFTLRTTQSHR